MTQIKEKESDIQSSICQYLEMRKICHWRNNSGAFKTERGGFYRFGTAGSPDIIVIKDGWFIGLEVKTKVGKQSPAQKEFEIMIKDAGAEYHLVRSIDDVQNIGL